MVKAGSVSSLRLRGATRRSARDVSGVFNRKRLPPPDSRENLDACQTHGILCQHAKVHGQSWAVSTVFPAYDDITAGVLDPYAVTRVRDGRSTRGGGPTSLLLAAHLCPGRETRYFRCFSMLSPYLWRGHDESLSETRILAGSPAGPHADGDRVAHRGHGVPNLLAGVARGYSPVLRPCRLWWGRTCRRDSHWAPIFWFLTGGWCLPPMWRRLMRGSIPMLSG
jgi:hypothetical protein